MSEQEPEIKAETSPEKIKNIFDKTTFENLKNELGFSLPFELKGDETSWELTFPEGYEVADKEREQIEKETLKIAVGHAVDEDASPMTISELAEYAREAFSDDEDPMAYEIK